PSCVAPECGPRGVHANHHQRGGDRGPDARLLAAESGPRGPARRGLPPAEAHAVPASISVGRPTISSRVTSTVWLPGTRPSVRLIDAGIPPRLIAARSGTPAARPPPACTMQLVLDLLAALPLAHPAVHDHT